MEKIEWSEIDTVEKVDKIAETCVSMALCEDCDYYNSNEDCAVAARLATISPYLADIGPAYWSKKDVEAAVKLGKKGVAFEADESNRIKATLISNEIEVATGFTIWKDRQKVNLRKMLRAEHSPIRTILFKIELRKIPAFVSVHLTRHSQTGELHFVSSCREDRGYEGEATRSTPVNHMMILNAQHLINISRYRLCTTSHQETAALWKGVCEACAEIIPELEEFLVPNCLYRGHCPEFRSCGYLRRYKEKQNGTTRGN